MDQSHRSVRWIKIIMKIIKCKSKNNPKIKSIPILNRWISPRTSLSSNSNSSNNNNTKITPYLLPYQRFPSPQRLYHSPHHLRLQWKSVMFLKTILILTMLTWIALSHLFSLLRWNHILQLLLLLLSKLNTF